MTSEQVRAALRPVNTLLKPLLTVDVTGDSAEDARLLAKSIIVLLRSIDLRAEPMEGSLYVPDNGGLRGINSDVLEKLEYCRINVNMPAAPEIAPVCCRVKWEEAESSAYPQFTALIGQVLLCTTCHKIWECVPAASGGTITWKQRRSCV